MKLQETGHQKVLDAQVQGSFATAGVCGLAEKWHLRRCISYNLNNKKNHCKFGGCPYRYDIYIYLLIFADFTLRNCGTQISDYIRCCWAQGQWKDGLTWKVRMYLAPWFMREYHDVANGLWRKPADSKSEPFRTIIYHHPWIRVWAMDDNLAAKLFFLGCGCCCLVLNLGRVLRFLSASWKSLPGWFLYPVPQRDPTFAQVWALAWWWLEILCEELRQLPKNLAGVGTSKKKE